MILSFPSFHFFLIVFFYFGEVQAFEYKEVKSGDSYEAVKKFLVSKGNKIIEYYEKNRLTTEYGSNILATFVFKNDKLCKVYTNYGEREFRWIVSDIDYKIRKFGSPLKIVSSGEVWGDGFVIHWQNHDQKLFYDVGKLDLFGKECSVVKSTDLDTAICK